MLFVKNKKLIGLKVYTNIEKLINCKQKMLNRKPDSSALIAINKENVEWKCYTSE